MYDIPSMTMNGRNVSMNDILAERITGDTEFERSSFRFIKDWLSSVSDFTLPTSGSTGQAKPVIISRRQMQQSASLTVNALGLTKDDTALVCLHTQYIAGKMMLVRALETGMKIIAVEPSSDPLRDITFKIDFTALVPLQLQTILASGKKSLDQLDEMKAILVGGAAVSDDLRKELHKIHAPVYSTYGMTETISHIALQRLDGTNNEPYFNILPGINIEQDERGCLLIKAPYLSETVVTNDLIRRVSTDKFEWLGRLDNVINSGGIKVMPEQLEHKIGKIFSQLNIPQNFFVHGIPDKSLGFKIILVVEGQKYLDEKLIFKVLHQTFSKYEIPKEIILIPEFVYTETGKINRLKTANLI